MNLMTSAKLHIIDQDLFNIFLRYHKIEDAESIKYNKVSDDMLSKLKLNREVIINDQS